MGGNWLLLKHEIIHYKFPIPIELCLKWHLKNGELRKFYYPRFFPFSSLYHVTITFSNQFVFKESTLTAASGVTRNMLLCLCLCVNVNHEMTWKLFCSCPWLCHNLGLVRRLTTFPLFLNLFPLFHQKWGNHQWIDGWTGGILEGWICT